MQHLPSESQRQFKHASFWEALYFPCLSTSPGVRERRRTEMRTVTSLRLPASTSWLLHRPWAILLIGNRTYSQIYLIVNTYLDTRAPRGLHRKRFANQLLDLLHHFIHRSCSKTGHRWVFKQHQGCHGTVQEEKE